jgi:hypothetical protein
MVSFINKFEQTNGNPSEFQKNVLNGDFNEAYKIMLNMTNKDIQDQLIEISVEDQCMLPYVFMVNTLLMKENAEDHSIMANLMISSYNVLNSAYEIALWHAKRALEINDKCIEALAIIMYLGMHPDSKLTREDTEKARKRIEEIDPNHPYLKEKIWN